MRPSSSPGHVSYLGGSWNSARGSSPRPGAPVTSRDWDPVARDAKRELSRIKYSEADPDAFTVRLRGSVQNWRRPVTLRAERLPAAHSLLTPLARFPIRLAM